MTEEEIRDRVRDLFASLKVDDPDGKVEQAVVDFVRECVADSVCPKMTW